MAQVTIYMDDETEARMRTAAKQAGLSMSAWIARLVNQRVETEWPPGIVALAGAWRDFPTAEEIRASQGVDLPREPL